MNELVLIFGTNDTVAAVLAHLSPDKQEAPRISSNPSKEKSVSPRLAMNNPAQIINTTSTILQVITSNLNATAHSRILAQQKAIGKAAKSEQMELIQLVAQRVAWGNTRSYTQCCSSKEDGSTVEKSHGGGVSPNERARLDDSIERHRRDHVREVRQKDVSCCG